MSDGPKTSTLVAFGRFRFDPATGELWRDGHAVRLAPKPAQVLALLVGSAGQLVTRETLEREVWGAPPIDLDRSVNFAIRQIRSALGDSADAPAYIETLPRRGYRFIAPVAHPDHGRSVDAPATVQAPTLRGQSGRSWLSAAAVIVAVGGLGAATAFLRGAGAPDGTVPTPTTRATLAVLPLEQLGSDPSHDYFVSGLTDEVITRMARLDPDHLTVIAPVSSRRARDDGGSDAQVAAALDADYLLRGTITPTETGVRIGLRLVDPTDDSVLWAQRYVEPVPTTPALEYEIASRVAEALRTRLPLRASPAGGPASGPASDEARDLYLRGAYLLEQGWSRVDDATELLRASVDADPTFAPSRTALGRALIRRGRRAEGRRHLTDASALDPALAEPHISLGMDALYALWDMEAAGAHFERALALDPGNVRSHHPYAYYLSIAGRHEEAIAEIEAAFRLDPVSPLVHGDVGRIYYRAGRLAEAEERCRSTLELVEDHAAALSCLININVLQGEADSALEFALRSLGDGDAMVGVKRHLRSLPADQAMKEYFEGRLEILRAAAARGSDMHVAMAQMLLFLGRTDEALDALEAALEVRSTVLPQVPGDPCFAVLVGEPRFEAIVAAMGLTELP